MYLIVVGPHIDTLLWQLDKNPRDVSFKSLEVGPVFHQLPSVGHNTLRIVHIVQHDC